MKSNQKDYASKEYLKDNRLSIREVIAMRLAFIGIAGMLAFAVYGFFSA